MGGREGKAPSALSDTPRDTSPELQNCYFHPGSAARHPILPVKPVPDSTASEAAMEGFRVRSSGSGLGVYGLRLFQTS